ncbi:MAG: pyridoxal phosphate-dependent aminotransferase [bacterium]
MSVSTKQGLMNHSLAIAIAAKAMQMKHNGMDVIGFDECEPNFEAPIHIKEAAKKALDEELTYTKATCIEELKGAICKKLKKDNNLYYSPEEILVSCGIKHSLFNAILALCNKGDEVILPSPYWPDYLEMIKIAGAKPVILKTTQENSFKIKPWQLKKLITPRTKLLLLNSPSNPAGMVYTKPELLFIRKILVENGVFCLSDEIYEKIIYDGHEHVSIASLDPEMKRLTIVVNGFSQMYSMPAWRIGYAAGKKEIIEAMGNVQRHSNSHPPYISQKATLAALEGPQDSIATMIAQFDRKRNYIMKKLNFMNGVFCLLPMGTSYVFPDFSLIIGETFKGKVIKNTNSLAEILLTEANVKVIPGSVFGVDDNVRLSYTTSMENIVEGLQRIEEFINNIMSRRMSS